MKYTFQNIWKKSAPEVRQAAIDFWISLHAFEAYDKAIERASEIVFVVHDENQRIIAVSTGFVARIELLRHNFYAFRLLIHPSTRIPGLMSKLALATRDHFAAIAQSDHEAACKGVVTIVENERLKEQRREAVWPATKMLYAGKTAKGHHLRVYYFPGVEI